MTGPDARPDGEKILRIAVFRVPEDNPSLHEELRHLADPERVRCLWVGRRVGEDPRTTEITVVTLVDGPDGMGDDVAIVPGGFSTALAAAVQSLETEEYSCRAYGAWQRQIEPCLVRLFRGQVVEGDPEAFNSSAAALYLASFESNPRCCSIAAAVRSERDVVIATLWTDWDAIASATEDAVGQVRRIRLPGWGVAGSAVHYELLAAGCRES